MVEVPVRVDQVRDRIVAEAAGRLENPQARRRDARIDEDLAIRAGQHGNVPAGPFENGDITPQLMDLDWAPGSLVADQVHDVAGLGENISWAQPSARRCISRCTDAAKAKSAARNPVFTGHG